MHAQFEDDDYQFGFENALGAAAHGGSDVGEVLATAARIHNGDADSWLAEWTATAGAAWSAARDAATAGHRVSARSHYLRAATYYSTALYRVAQSSEPERQLEIWRRHRACWDAAVDLFLVPGERIAIAYGETTLPGYFFRAPDAAPRERRPLVVMNNGSDGATSSMWRYGGAAASERGYHWMTFDGPGQQAALFEQGIPFRPDWEAVLTPVLDAMLARADVDPARVAVIGVSQAGFWVPRALAFEHRFAAAIVDPGVVDVSTAWTDELPRWMRSELYEGKQASFDRTMRLAERFSHGTRAILDFRGAPFGVGSDSRYELFKATESYRLGPEVGQITTPILITDPEDEQFWPGQSKHLFARIVGEKRLVPFTAQEGARGHCEPLGAALRDARLYDWLADRLA
jgi:hypothetical protein